MSADGARGEGTRAVPIESDLQRQIDDLRNRIHDLENRLEQVEGTQSDQGSTIDEIRGVLSV